MNLILNSLITLADAKVDLPSEINLSRPIVIPTFIDFSSIAGSSATVFSLLSFVGVMATIGIVIFWIYKILRLGVEGLQSEGKSEKIQELTKRLRYVLTGAFMSFLFPVILSIIGIFVGIGTIFEWPRMFRSCEVGGYHYYFQAYLAQNGSTAINDADNICGYSSTGGPGGSGSTSDQANPN